MSASHRYSPERIVTVTVNSTGDVWTNETGERVFVDRIELVLEPDVDVEPTIVAEVGQFVEPGETCFLKLHVTEAGRKAAS